MSLLSFRDLTVGWGQPLFAPVTGDLGETREPHVVGAARDSGAIGAQAGGQTVALLGENGRGKSTLLACLAGRLAPLSGEVRICGRNPAQLSPPDRAMLVSVLLSRQPAPGALRLNELLLLNPRPSGLPNGGYRVGVSAAGGAERRAAVLAALGLESLEDRRLAELSDGQRQRAFLARSVLQETPVLLADEPLLHLDTRSTRSAMQALSAEAREGGRLVICSIHDLPLAVDWADKLMLISGRRLHRITSAELAGNTNASREFRDALQTAGFLV